MTKKQMLFGAIILISMSNLICLTVRAYQNKDFVFNKRMFTSINGNSIYSYLYLQRTQSNPSYVFKHTRVVECSKDKKFTEVGTLGSLEKVYRLRSFGSKTSVDKFEKFAKMNNAIYCCNVEQKLNYYDSLENVGAIIYGTQKLEDCPLFKEYLAQQKLIKDNGVLLLPVDYKEEFSEENNDESILATTPVSCHRE
jgi:hypothetical protein